MWAPDRPVLGLRPQPRRRQGRARGSVLAAIILWLFAGLALAQDTPAPRPVVVLDVAGAIGPATTEYLTQGLDAAADRNARLVVIRMNTPGGLDSSTRDIIQAILASPTPVATFVTPSGARAASAGTYILYASHLAAMSPGTHQGAATPVRIGGPSLPGQGGGDDDSEGAAADPMTAKVVNDAAAYIASLAALQGRNAEWAERAVRDAATLTASAALAENVVEIVAADLNDLLAQAHGRTVQLRGEPHVLDTEGAPIVEIEPDWRSRLLSVITDPNIAYLMLLAGAYGLLFEFMSPGAVVPGVVGGICLLVALFALNLLPINFAGLGLLLLGAALIAAEALTPTIGILGAGGVVAFGLGSLLLFDEPAPGFALSPVTVIAAMTLSLGFTLLVLTAAVRSRRFPIAAGGESTIGARAKVISWSGREGFAQLQGERWRARSAGPLRPGDEARVLERHGLELVLESPTDPSPEETSHARRD